MGRFGNLSVKVRVRGTRGDVDAEAVTEAMQDGWDQVRQAIDSLEESEQDELRAHFNGLIEEHRNLGDLLFGDAEEFVEAVQSMDAEFQRMYTEELMDQDVISRASLEGN